MKFSVWIGFDDREAPAFAVAAHSARRHASLPLEVNGIVLPEVRAAGLYTRPTERRDGRLWDTISDAPMSTEFAISRFLTPILAREGWALFMDGDVLIRGDLWRLFAERDESKALMCVKHEHRPPVGVKMDGQAQLPYPRKNWSSVMLFNCAHPANRALTLDLINSAPGRDLHGMCWLEDDQIGSLSPGWNWLVGHSKGGMDPQIVHFTDGYPMMAGYERAEFSDEWRRELARWGTRP